MTLPDPNGLEPTILVVDDDADVRESLSEFLELHGYEVVAAADGMEALDRLQTVSPCAVLLDVKMPGMDGVAL